MALEAYRDQAKEAAVAATPQEPKAPTLADTMADKKNSALFGNMLHVEGGEGVELGAKMADPSTLEPGDFYRLAERHGKFLEKMARVKEVGAMITKENVADFGTHSPEFQNLLKLAGPEKMVHAIQNQLRSFAVNDETGFKALEDSIHALNDYRTNPNSDYKRLDDETTKWCKANKVSESAYVKIMQNTDEKARIKELGQDVRKSYGFFMNAIDLLSFRDISRSEAKGIGGQARKDEIDAVIKQVDSRVKTIGETLYITIDDNPEVRAAFMSEIVGERTEEVKEMSFKDMRASMQAPEALDRGLATAWKEYRKRKEYGRMTDDFKLNAQEEFGEEQARQYGDEAVKKGGFWAWVLGAFLGEHVKKTVSKFPI